MEFVGFRFKSEGEATVKVALYASGLAVVLTAVAAGFILLF